MGQDSTRAFVTMKFLCLCLLLCFCSPGFCLGQTRTTPCARCVQWNQPQKPFRIWGNTFYVGPHGLSSILITSDRGHVLIDGALPESAKQIAANIQSLGFRMADVKLILNSHVHFDHAGGIAELQRVSGARVEASEWSAKVLSNGGIGKGDPQFAGGTPISPVANVQTFRDGDQIRAGEIVITAHLTPGHTAREAQLGPGNPVRKRPAGIWFMPTVWRPSPPTGSDFPAAAIIPTRSRTSKRALRFWRRCPAIS